MSVEPSPRVQKGLERTRAARMMDRSPARLLARVEVELGRRCVDPLRARSATAGCGDGGEEGAGVLVHVVQHTFWAIAVTIMS